MFDSNQSRVFNFSRHLGQHNMIGKGINVKTRKMLFVIFLEEVVRELFNIN